MSTAKEILDGRIARGEATEDELLAAAPRDPSPAAAPEPELTPSDDILQPFRDALDREFPGERAELVAESDALARSLTPPREIDPEPALRVHEVGERVKIRRRKFPDAEMTVVRVGKSTALPLVDVVEVEWVDEKGETQRQAFPPGILIPHDEAEPEARVDEPDPDFDPRRPAGRRSR